MDSLIKSPSEQIKEKIRKSKDSLDFLQKIQNHFSSRLLQIKRRPLITQRQEREASVLVEHIRELDTVKRQIEEYADTLIQLYEKLPDAN